MDIYRVLHTETNSPSQWQRTTKTIQSRDRQWDTLGLTHRSALSGITVTKFNECLNLFFEKGEAGEKGLPTVNAMASQLHLLPKYLSDLLKQETGKTALELIHLYM